MKMWRKGREKYLQGFAEEHKDRTLFQTFQSLELSRHVQILPRYPPGEKYHRQEREQQQWSVGERDGKEEKKGGRESGNTESGTINEHF